jgi:hypothetical protein
MQRALAHLAAPLSLGVDPLRPVALRPRLSTGLPLTIASSLRDVAARTTRNRVCELIIELFQLVPLRPPIILIGPLSNLSRSFFDSIDGA